MLADIISPILERLGATNLRFEDESKERLVASIPFLHGVADYLFEINNEIIRYSRGDLSNTFKVSEIERINHFLVPLYKRIKHRGMNSNVAQIPASDLVVRLHLLFTGDVFISTSRVLFTGAGIQATQDIYVVR